MTTWGVGTGRCGTKSLSVDLGGLHEPKPWIRQDARNWWMGIDREACEKRLLEKLEQRMGLGVPIVDLKHSFVIPLIVRVDPEAEFVWVIRNPVDCVSSLLNGNVWTPKWIKNTNGMIAPTMELPESYSDRERFEICAWYWEACNLSIMFFLKSLRKDCKIIVTEELKSHENKYTNMPERQYTQGQARRLGELWAIYEAVLGERG